MKKIITFEGGSAFGKSSVADKFLVDNSFKIYPSISKEVNIKINNQWKNPPVQFSDIFFDLRLKQYNEAINLDTPNILFDRFLFFPIVIRLFSNIKVPMHYYKILEKKCQLDKIYLFEPIPLDKYENGWPRKNLSYDESLKINEITYRLISNLGYNPIIVPYDTVDKRYEFIKNSLC